MDAALLARFVAAQREALHGATVQRVVCVGDGLVLALRTRRGAIELGLLGARGAAWVYCLLDEPRAELHAAVASLVPDLMTPIPADFGLRQPAPTALDALRAWLVRPAAAPPAWLQMEGAVLRDLRAAPGDRRLWLTFERVRTTDTATWTLTAELFDRGANFLLSDASGSEIANWSGRRAAPEAHHSGAHDGTPHDSADAAHADLAAAAHAALAAAAAVALARAHRQGLQRESKRLHGRLTKLEADAARAAEADVWRRQAEILSANLHRLQRGQEQIEVEDLFAPGTRITLALDPALAPHENVALLFKRAKRAARGQETVASRLDAARAAARALETQMAGLDDSADSWPRVLLQAGDTWRAALSSALARADTRTLWSPGGPPWQLPTPPRDTTRAERGPGRTFVLPGNWEVRVGRSNTENDELTHRFAAADDVWLHASGSPGSHVVLRMHGRKDNPPRDVLEAAAAIAARFSQAKHARTVPVVWTRKRYVRKPRGGAPGLAVCTHEKTLFVRPALPATQQERVEEED